MKQIKNTPKQHPLSEYKKFISLFLSLCLFVTLMNIPAQAQLQPRENKERLRIQVLKVAQEIENNRFEIKTLIEETRGKTYEVKQSIQSIRENLDTLSLDQLKLLKQIIIEIKKYHQAKDVFLKTMSEYNIKIKSARDAKDFETLLTLYNEIALLQTKHKEALTNYSTLLDQLLAMM